ncbi:MAG: hypothetical protein AAGE01_00485 [Pseudomonadota bacterium]
MNLPLLWSATAVAFVAFLVHTFVGGRRVARPLLADRSLPPASKWLNYYCWHAATVMLAFVTIAFAWAAVDPTLAPVVVFGGTLAVALSALSAAVASKAGIHPLRFPSTSLLAGTGLLALAAVIA